MSNPEKYPNVEPIPFTPGSVIQAPGIGALFLRSDGKWQGTRNGVLHGQSAYTVKQVAGFQGVEIIHNALPGHHLNAEYFSGA